MKLTSVITSLLSTLLFTSFGQSPLEVKETQGIEIGDTITNFNATDQHGKLFDLETELEKGPVVVIFYRGQWCPYCNKHLSQLQDSLALIESKGAQVISISPENQEHLLESVEKTGAEFRLLYDEGYVISNLFDVLFDPRSGEVKKYNIFLGADLENAHSDNTNRLPVPATFIIGTDRIIKWRHFNHNYKKRSTVQEILNHLE